MAKITRKTQKILGSNSSNTGIFGNAQKGIYDQFSQDPDIIQTPEWESGWNQATFSGAKIPPLEERQAVDLVVTRQIAYVLQEGIPEWDSETEYHENSIVKESGTTNLYYSITDDNVGNPVSDPLNWTQFSFGVSDGNKVDVTVSGGGDTWTINNGAVNTDKLGGDITAAGKALLDDADASAQRNTLGLGSSAVEDVGTQVDDVLQFTEDSGDKVLEVDSARITGAADPEDAQDVATKAYVDALAPVVVNTWSATYTANANLGTIPNDNTAPLIGEGTQLAQILGVQLKKIGNKLRVTVGGFGGFTTGVSPSGFLERGIIVSHFQGNTCVYSIKSGCNAPQSSDGPINISHSYEFLPNTLSPFDMTFRAGGIGDGSTYRLNGSSSGALFQGTAVTHFLVEEIEQP